jgi:hypothetical protein
VHSIFLVAKPLELYLGSWLPMPVCSSVFLTTSCSCFKVSVLVLKSLIHFELILVQGKRQGSSY